MIRQTVPDDRSGNAETSFPEFRCCSRHGQISTFRRTETGSATEIRRRYADVLAQVWLAWSHGGGITAAAVACLQRSQHRSGRVNNRPG